MEPVENSESPASDLLDEFLPEEFDWRRLVKAYPIAALLVAGAGGFVLGRSRGAAILAALSGFAADTLTRGVNEFLGEDVL